jgi:hypothetical protein
VTYDVYQRESDNHPDDPNNDPEPLTPEERYDLHRHQWSLGGHYEMPNTVGMIQSLRDMIASLDAEMARLTETVNRLERQIDWNAG